MGRIQQPAAGPNGDRQDERAPLRVALIGAGAMGSLHARVVSQHALARLDAIVDIDEGAGRSLAERFGCPYRRDLEAGLFDAVVVASPTETHFEWVSRALELGLPVLVEKPMAFDLRETRAMIDRAAALDVPLMCGFIERFNPAVMLATEIV